jgi:hypothetical protein
MFENTRIVLCEGKEVATCLYWQRGVLFKKGLSEALQCEATDKRKKDFQLPPLPCPKNNWKCFWHFGTKIWYIEISY